MEPLSKDLILSLFHEHGGNLDRINQSIDAKFKKIGTRKLSTFEQFIRTRLTNNPKILKMANMEINADEMIFLSSHPDIGNLHTLDLRQNFFGDAGLIALSESDNLNELETLDLRNNQITRLGVEFFSKSTRFNNLREIDLRANKLGRRWEGKLLGLDHFPELKTVKTL